MRLLALVTARGGSKGFPGKNVAMLHGRPLVGWSHYVLDAFRTAHPELDMVLHLSTDNAFIAGCWPQPDMPTRLRPAELAQDTSTSIDVALYELDQLAAEGKPCDALLLLQPTSPLITLDDLEAMLDASMRAESVMAVTPTPHPIQWCMYRTTNGTTTSAVPSIERMRRQDYEATYLPVGMYLCTADFLRRNRRFSIHGETASVVIPADHAIDIDHHIDLDVASAILERTRGKKADYVQSGCIS